MNFFRGIAKISVFGLLTIYYSVPNTNLAKENQCLADLDKTFDRINQSYLIQKLDLQGFQTKFIQWISSYLCNRIQRETFITIN